LQIDFVIQAPKEKSRSLRALTTAYKGEKYAEKYHSVGVGNGFTGNREHGASSCGSCARADPAAATGKLQLDCRVRVHGLSLRPLS
jgi:hypothetical protein